MHWGFRLGIRNQLLVIALTATIPGFAVLGWHLISEWDHAVEIAQLRAKVVADEVNRDLWGIFRDFREVAGEIARRPQVRGLNAASCDPFLREYASLHGEIAALTVRDLSGGLVCSSVIGASVALLPSQSHLVTDTVTSGAFTVSGVERGPSSGKWVVGLTLPIRGDTAETQAVLFLTLDLFEYSRRILSDLPEGTIVTVLDRDKNVAMRSEDLESWIGKSFGRDLARTGEGVLRGRDASGKAYLGAYVAEAFSGWIVISTAPESVLLVSQKVEQRWVVAISAIVSLAFVLMMMKTAGGLAQPLLALAAIARRVAQGDAGARAPESRTPEIAEVSAQFNHMLDMIEWQQVETREAADRMTSLANQLVRLEEIGSVGGFARDLGTGAFTLTPGSCRILELDPADPDGQQAYLKSIRFLTPRFSCVLEKAAADGKPWNLDVLVETAAGKERWLYARGEVEMREGHASVVVGHIHDITERKLLDMRLHSIVETSPVPYAISDRQRGITYVNQAFTRIFGYESADLRSYADWSRKLFPNPADLARFERDRAAYLAMLEDGHAGPPMELSVTAGDGSTRHTIAVFAKLRTSKDGDLVICLQDVSELRATTDRLRASQKMEAFGRLASGIAHDFNNLLGIINAGAELLRDQDGRRQDTQASTALILKACNRGADLTRRLLIFSRKSNANPSDVSVTQILDDLSAVLRRTLGSNITVEIAVSSDDLHVFADATLFHTALYNLAVNARDAMPVGGKLSFRVDHDFARVGARMEEEVVTISVTDTGTGMSADVTDKIFEPFFTTKEAGKGTGLGLSMVYGFVTEAGGDIRVDSIPGRGTTFTMRFPRSRPQRPQLAQDGPRGAAYAGSQKVLLVEDDEDLREVTALQLQSLGLTVHAAASTREAFALLASEGGFHALITDFRLSEAMNGAQLARGIEAQSPGISIMVMSGYLSAEEAGQLDSRWPLLEKPVKKEDLEFVLRKIPQARAAS